MATLGSTTRMLRPLFDDVHNELPGVLIGHDLGKIHTDPPFEQR